MVTRTGTMSHGTSWYSDGSQTDWWNRVSKHLLKACILSIAILAATAAPALAYSEYSTGAYPSVNYRTDPSLTAPTSCPDCHGLESGASSPTVAPRSVPSTWSSFDTEAGTNVSTRKGPHGGYTSGTQKCETCHTTHGASAFSIALLPSDTIKQTCETCHDGTGGGGVYGVIKQRTGIDPEQVINGKTRGGVHRVGPASLNGNGKVTVPGGNANGSSLETTFSGENGAMTCTDCHSPHNSKTVKPFLGDRLRSTNDSLTAGIKTNKLLKARPTSAVATATEYGSDWCEACHKGRHDGVAGTVQNHPVADTVSGGASWNYNRVSKRSGYLGAAMTTGSLGGDNFGYVMPESPRPLQPKPICQQCHEDERNVGDVNQSQITNPSEAFNPSVDGTSSAGNPRFQNFPHETPQATLLIEQYDDLCLNCHLAP